MSQRTTTLAPGASWALPVGEHLIKKDDVPLKWRLAFTELGKQFYRVVAKHYVHPLLGEGGALQIEIYRSKDELNPIQQEIVLRHGQMFRKDARSGLWPVYREDKKTAPSTPKRALRRNTVRRMRAEEVREDRFDDNVHSIFCERAEINDDYEDAELEFTKNPTVQTFIVLKTLRKQMEEVEMRIVGAAIATQAAKDIAAL